MPISGEELRDAREIVANMTQADLAELLDVSVRTIGNWETSGVPARRESRVMDRFGDALRRMRGGYEAMAEREAFYESAAGRDLLEREAAQYREEEQRRTDPVRFGLRHASDDQLLAEGERRIKRRRPPQVVKLSPAALRAFEG